MAWTVDTDGLETWIFAIVNYGGVEFWSLDRRIYDCKLRNEKKDFIQVRDEYWPQPSKLLYNCPLKNKEALYYVKGLSENGGRADFSKNLSRLFLLKKAYRMNLISAGSISLDSTFKVKYIWDYFLLWMCRLNLWVESTENRRGIWDRSPSNFLFWRAALISGYSLLDCCMQTKT